MALCDHRFTATQYALLSALASFGRVYVGPVSGYATDPKYWGSRGRRSFSWLSSSRFRARVRVVAAREIQRVEARGDLLRDRTGCALMHDLISPSA